MKAGKLVFQYVLMLVLLLIPIKVSATPSYQYDFYKLSSEIEDFFHAYGENAIMSYGFVDQQMLAAKPFYFSEDIYQISDLCLGWYGEAGQFSDPEIIFDELGVKLIKFDLTGVDLSFPAEAASFLGNIFFDIIQAEQIQEINVTYGKFIKEDEDQYKEEFELADSREADIYLQKNVYEDELRIEISIYLKERDEKRVLQGMEYYSLIIRSNQTFYDFVYPLLLSPEDTREEMYVFNWTSYDEKKVFTLAFEDASKLNLTYINLASQKSDIAEELSFLFGNVAPEYFEKEILNILEWLVDRCLEANEPIIWEETNSFFVLMLFPSGDSQVAIYTIFDYML